MINKAVLLPGTGSDEVFVTSVFAGPLAAAGLRLVAPVPMPGAELAERHLADLDAAASNGPVLAGGISFGAHLAAEWALLHPDRCAGLLLAMPAWSGDPGGDSGAGSDRDPALAAAAALASADAVDADGLDVTLARITADSPPWLAGELDRSWRRQGRRLPGSLRVAARRPAPTLAALGRITVPVGVAACTDDPVHPLSVARAWADALPAAALCTTTLADLDPDRESLGRVTVAAWRRATGHRAR